MTQRFLSVLVLGCALGAAGATAQPSLQVGKITEGVWAAQPSEGANIGWFVSGEYQLAKRWFAGVRFEESDRANDQNAKDSGAALLVTFWPSEFSQLRGELRRRKYGFEGITANEALLQLQFAIGAHGAHPF